MKMKRTIICILLVIFTAGCISLKEKEDYFDEWTELRGQYNTLVNQCNNISANLTNQYINAIQECALWGEKWANYLWNESYYNFYPTGCRNPKQIFTMCREGCDIIYYCDTESMNPLFNCDAKLTFAECDEYVEGDIVLVANQNRWLLPDYVYLVHQIIDINGENITTKGFNNYGVDNFTSTVMNLSGKVVQIEYN